MLDSDKKIFMTIILNFYIVINKNYLYNYSKKVENSILISIPNQFRRHNGNKFNNTHKTSYLPSLWHW